MTNQKDDIYATLKKLGSQLEELANEKLKQELDREEFVLLGKLGSQVMSRFLKQANEVQDLLSTHFNYPTKDDLARVAKLVLQSEEKIDCLEERVNKLLKFIKKAESSPDQNQEETNEASVQDPKRAETNETTSPKQRNRSERLKLFLELTEAMNKNSFLSKNRRKES